MVVSKATKRCFLLGFLFAACSGTVEAVEGKTCREFSLPEDAAEAKAFAKELADQGRPGKPVTVSTTWRTGDSEADRAGREALVRMKDLQGQMEAGLKRVGEALVDSKKDLTDISLKNVALKSAIEGIQTDAKKNAEDLKEVIKQINNPRLRCIAAGSDMTFTRWGCYKAFEVRKNWVDAREHCASLGLELPSFAKGPGTREALIQLGRDVGLDNDYYWVDLTRVLPSGEWRWRSGARLEKGAPSWGKTEPTNGAREDKGYFETGYGLRVHAGATQLCFLCAAP